MPAAPSCRRRFLSLRFWCRAVAGLTLIYCSIILLLLAIENRLVFRPVPASVRWREPLAGVTFEDVEFEGAHGVRLHGRWFPCPRATGAVLICHGRSGNLSQEVGPNSLAGWHKELGVSAFLFDYPGYGRSRGIPDEAGCYAAADGAYGWLTRTKNVPPGQVLIFGQSLGTAVAVDRASRRPHRALVLVAPFTSLPDVAVSNYLLLPAPLLMHNRFASLEKIGRCTRPVFIAHGTDDHMVPFTLGKRLFDAANEPKLFLTVPGAHHNCVNDMFFPELRRFLTSMPRT
jgi:fermentation-respiration switch protein FrsA (DUF1100 family)